MTNRVTPFMVYGATADPKPLANAINARPVVAVVSGGSAGQKVSVGETITKVLCVQSFDAASGDPKPLLKEGTDFKLTSGVIELLTDQSANTLVVFYIP